MPSMWGECEAQDGMHFNAQRYVAIELIDPDSGQPLPWAEGATGEIVYTAFARDATPVVRYRSRDHALVIGVALRLRPHQPAHPLHRPHRRHADLQGHERVSRRRSATCRRSASPARSSRCCASWKDRKRPGALRRADCRSTSRPRAALDDAAQRGRWRARSKTRCARSCRCASRSRCCRAAALPRGVYKNALVAVRDSATERIHAMKFQRAAFSSRHLWSSPFVRWQGSLADVSSLDLAVAVTRDALAQRHVRSGSIEQLVLGTTDPAAAQFLRRAVDRRAARHAGHQRAAHRAGLRHVGGVRGRGGAAGRGDRPCRARWSSPRTAPATGRCSCIRARVRWAAARRPRTGCSTTSPSDPEHRAVDGAHRRGGGARGRACRAQALDELTLLRHRQYQSALADDRASSAAGCSRWLIEQGRSRLVVEHDEGVHDDHRRRPARAEAGARRWRRHLRQPDASGRRRRRRVGAGARRCAHAGRWRRRRAAGRRRPSRAPRRRACRRRRPRAAQRALEFAGLGIADVHVVTTHNPFAVNDLWFAQQTGFALDG